MVDGSIQDIQKGRTGKWAMLQGWENLLFLHWPVSPEKIKPYVPSGLEVDTYDGKAWVSIVSFKVPITRLRYLPRIPYFPKMLQVNVRTYVKREGDKGIYFFTVDTNKLSAVLGAKLATLPYTHANMRLKDRSGSIDLYSSRTGDVQATWEVTYQSIGDWFVPEPTSIDYWLLERYIMWSDKSEHLFRADIKHDKWEVRIADYQIKENTLLSFLSIDAKNTPSLAHYASSKVSLNWVPTKVT